MVMNSYHTAERMQLHLWPRRKRLKFYRRFRREHGGVRFRWFMATPRYAFKPYDGDQPMILFKREPNPPSFKDRA